MTLVYLIAFIIQIAYGGDTSDANNPLEITVNNLRGQRFCEIVELNLPESATLYTSLTQHKCSQEVWDDVKAAVFFPFIPIDIRYITRDTSIIPFTSPFLQTQEFVGLNDPENNKLTFLNQLTNFNPPADPIPDNFTQFFTYLGDVIYKWDEDKTIFLLIDEFDNHYIMASTTTQDLDQLEIDLPIRYENLLPDGWELEIRKAKKDIIWLSSFPAVLIIDGIGNNYFLLSKDECISCDKELKKSKSCKCDKKFCI